MATNLLTSGAGYAESAEFTIPSGETATVCLKSASSGASVRIEMKDESSGWHLVDHLNISGAKGVDARARVISGPGAFRVVREANDAACGVFRG